MKPFSATLPSRAVPDWFRRAVVYQVQPLVFTPERTIAAAAARLPALADIGITCVYMCPVTVADDDPREEMWSPRQRASGFGNPRNPYRTGDYFHVDPEYGTDEDLRAFVKTAHRLGMKVLFDVVYYHCGPSARIVGDHPEYFSYDKEGEIVAGGWHFPKLDFENRGVREYFKANMVYWLADFDVDGFRCDVADGIPLDFWEEARDTCDRVKRDVVLLAEGSRFQNTRHAFDANYNWPVCLAWLRPILQGDTTNGFQAPYAQGGTDVSAYIGAAKLRAASEQYAAMCPSGALTLNFTENHDTASDDGDQRMERRCGFDNQNLGLALCFAMAGIPLIYNGQEIADASRHSIFGREPGVGIDWSASGTEKGRRRTEFIRALSALRRDNPAMTTPFQTWLENDAPDRVLSLRRGNGEDSVFFLGNFSDKPVNVGVSGASARCATTILSSSDRSALPVDNRFSLDPWGFVFARGTPPL